MAGDGKDQQMLTPATTNLIDAAMKGGNGGGGGKSPYPNAPVDRRFAIAPPGVTNLIAHQLSDGFGAPDKANKEFLANLYDPMKITQFMEPISTTRDAIATGDYRKIHTGNPTLNHILRSGKVKIGSGGGGKKKFDEPPVAVGPGSYGPPVRM